MKPAAIYVLAIAGANLLSAQSADSPSNSKKIHEGARMVSCDLPKDSSDGLAIFSGTLPDNIEWMNYIYVRQGAGFLSRKGFGLSRIHTSSDFPAMFGKVYSLRLPAGNYQFLFWRYHAFRSSVTETPKNIHPLNFTVQAGRAVYLGGFDTIGFKKQQGIFHQIVENDWVAVHDDRARDLPVFSGVCSAFDSSLIDIRVMDPAPWMPQQKNSNTEVSTATP